MRDPEKAYQLEISKLESQLDSANAKLAKCVGALKDIESNYDHDDDAHKYKTNCRCCIAKEALNFVSEDSK